MYSQLKKPKGRLVITLIATILGIGIPVAGAIMINSPIKQFANVIEIVSGSAANLLIDFSELLRQHN